MGHYLDILFQPESHAASNIAGCCTIDGCISFQHAFLATKPGTTASNRGAGKPREVVPGFRVEKSFNSSNCLSILLLSFWGMMPNSMPTANNSCSNCFYLILKNENYVKVPKKTPSSKMWSRPYRNKLHKPIPNIPQHVWLRVKMVTWWKHINLLRPYIPGSEHLHNTFRPPLNSQFNKDKANYSLVSTTRRQNPKGCFTSWRKNESNKSTQRHLLGPRVAVHHFHFENFTFWNISTGSKGQSWSEIPGPTLGTDRQVQVARRVTRRVRVCEE